MEKISQGLTTLTASIEETARHVFQSGLGYEVESISCQLLKSMDLIISVKRSLSATERFLIRENQPTLALEMGLTINNVLKERLFLTLVGEFNLEIGNISFLQPTSPERFELLLLMNSSSRKEQRITES